MAASGAPPLAYQWYKDGVRRGRRNHLALAFGYLSVTNAGSYWAIVTNARLSYQHCGFFGCCRGAKHQRAARRRDQRAGSEL